jgi:hypothetical protein
LIGGIRRLDGKLRAAAERPLLKKCSSDCGISVFSVDATKMQQLRMLNNGREGKAYTIVDRFLTYSIGPVEDFNLKGQKMGCSVIFDSKLSCGRTARPKGKACQFSALSQVREFADHWAV